MSSDFVEATAARWLVRRQDEGWTESDQRNLDSWLNESTFHRVAYIRLDNAWQQTARLKALGAGVPAGVIAPPGSWTGGSEPAAPRMPFKLWLGFAAALVLAVPAVAYLVVVRLHGPEQFATAVGSSRTVLLSDGSQVTLNTNTHISVDFRGYERRVDLESGETFIVVARQALRPFVIRVADKRVTAVGTEFLMRRAADEVQVLVTQGRVQLASAQATPSVRVTTLDAGTLARTSNAEVLVEPASAADMQRLLSWRTGFLIFRQTGLADVVAEFNRYRVHPLEIADPTIGSIRISGKFRSDNIEGFLALLQRGFPVSVETVNDRIVLRRRGAE